MLVIFQLRASTRDGARSWGHRYPPGCVLFYCAGDATLFDVVRITTGVGLTSEAGSALRSARTFFPGVVFGSVRLDVPPPQETGTAPALTDSCRRYDGVCLRRGHRARTYPRPDPPRTVPRTHDDLRARLAALRREPRS